MPHSALACHLASAHVRNGVLGRGACKHFACLVQGHFAGPKVNHGGAIMGGTLYAGQSRNYGYDSHVDAVLVRARSLRNTSQSRARSARSCLDNSTDICVADAPALELATSCSSACR